MFFERFSDLKKVVSSCSYTMKGEKVNPTVALQSFQQLLRRVKKEGKTTYVIGNGGSAGIASHFCIDLLNVLHIRALSLYDSNVMTCLGNDYGYEQIFSKQLEVLANEKDLLIAISSSGKSQNIVRAANIAKEKKLDIVTLSGFNSKNPLRALGDLNFWLDASDYGLVEMGHFFLLHTIVDSWKPELFSLKKIINHANSRSTTKN